MTDRRSDHAQIAILVVACAFAIFWPSIEGFAQSQDAINATLAEQMKGMALRVERIEAMVNGVMLALIANLIASIVKISFGPKKR